MNPALPSSSSPTRQPRAALTRRLLTALIAVLLLALLVAPRGAQAEDFTGVADQGVGQTINFTMSGVKEMQQYGLIPQLEPYKYAGAYVGAGPVSISGTMVSTLSVGGVPSTVAMRAEIRSGGMYGPVRTSWAWPEGGTPASTTEPATFTQPFSLTYTPTKADRETGVYLYAAIDYCENSFCDTLWVSANLDVRSTASAPEVQAYAIGKTLRIGKSYRQYFSAKDKSGKARISTALYENGTRIGTANSPGFVKAKGNKYSVRITPSKDRKGPLEFCVWAQNKAGVSSAKAPKSSCKWIDVLVPIKNVSNQCGGAGWDSIVSIQNWIGNSSSFYDNTLGEWFPVSFIDACNLHDAGYGGATVRDILDGKRGDRPIVNFRKWNRKRVDDKFQEDMKKICRRDIPKRAALARFSCLSGTGRYEAVRLVGGQFFDADLRTPGVQATGHRTND